MRRPDAACQPSASPAPKSTFWSKMLKKMVKWPSDKAASGRRACRSFLARLRRAAGRGRGSARTDLAAVDVVDSAQPRRLRCLPAVAAPARPRPPPPLAASRCEVLPWGVDSRWLRVSGNGRGMMRLAHWLLRARTDRSAAVVMCGATEFKIPLCLKNAWW